MNRESEALLNYLRVEAIRLHHFAFEEACTTSVPSKVDPLPHQLIAVQNMLRHDPIRFLVADDVGLGKTIMMGMLIKELKSRERANNVLVICPKSLLFQWQREMKEKFNLDFKIISSTKEASDLSPNQHPGNFILSMGLLGKKKAVESLLKGKWDLIIIDEAHNLTVREEREKISRTKRYAGAERLLLSDPFLNIVLLTATPHHGKTKDFIHRLRLIDPFVTESNVNVVLNEIMIRRLREEVRDFNDNRLIPDRESKIIKVTLSDQERNFFDKVNEYIRDYYMASMRESDRRKSKAYALVAMVIQKRASSSLNSLLQTLKKRRNKLGEIVNKGQNPSDQHQKGIDERRIVQEVTLSRNKEELSREISRLDDLIDEGGRIAKDSKLEKVEKVIEEHVSRGDKVIVFTEFRDTLFYLNERWKDKFRVSIVHGKMGVEERKRAETDFIEGKDVLIATNVASEGLNLQVANVVINYDLPWNPTRLDQRIGRVHRYGQKKKVLTYNVYTEETIDSHVLEILMNKLDIIKDTLGKVYDYLGVAVSDKDIEKVIRETTVKNPDETFRNQEIEKKIDSLLRKAERTAKEWNEYNLSYSFSNLDPSCDEKEEVTEEEVEMFVTETLKAYGVPPIRSRINPLLYDIRPPKGVKDAENLIVSNASFRFDECKRVKECNYIYPTHPLVRALIDLLKPSSYPISFTAENKRFMGWLLLFEVKGESDEVPVNGRVTEGMFYKKKLEKEKLIAILYDEVNKKVKRVETSFINSLTAVIDECGSEFLVIADEPEVKKKIREVEEQIKTEIEYRKNQIFQEVTDVIDQEIANIEKRRSSMTDNLDELFSRKSTVADLFNYAQIYTDSKLIAGIRLLPEGFSDITGNADVNSMKEFLNQGSEGEEIVNRLEQNKGCDVIDMRDVFTAGFDFLSICNDEVKYIEVKTVQGNWSKINITPVELMAMDPNNRTYRGRFTKAKLHGYGGDMREHFYLYIADLASKKVWEVKNPAASLREFLYQQKYMKTQRKVEIPYTDLLKYLQSNHVTSESF
ncbi:helicase [Sulfolobales archaeon HS-7]|nr:helicase [Sulfolobales archaeon HS-7]